MTSNGDFATVCHCTSKYFSYLNFAGHLRHLVSDGMFYFDALSQQITPWCQICQFSLLILFYLWNYLQRMSYLC